MAKRRPILRRKLAWALVLALAALGVYRGLEGPGFRRWLARMLGDRIEAATGDEVQVGGVDLGWWPPRVTVTGLLVRRRDGGKVVFSARRVRAVLGLRGWRPGVVLLELVRPGLHLHLDADGRLLDLPGLAGTTGGGGELPWKELRVRGGDATLEWAREGGAPLRVVARGIDVLPDLRPGRSDVVLSSLEVSAGGRSQRAELVRAMGATLGPDRVVLPDLDLDFPVAAISGRLAAMADGSVLSGALRVEIDTAELSSLAGGPVAIDGPLDADLELSGDLSDPVASLAVWARPALRSGDHRAELGELRGTLAAGRRGIRTPELLLDWAGGRIDVSGEMGWDGGVHDLVVTGENLGLARALVQAGAHPAPWIDMASDLELHLDGSLHPFALGGELDLAFRDLLVSDGPAGEGRSEPILELSRGSVAGRVAFEPDGVRVSVRSVRSGRSSGSAECTIGFGGTLDVRADFPHLDLSALRPLAGLDLGGTGSFEGRIHGPFSDLAIDGRLSADRFQVLGVPFADHVEGGVRAHPLHELYFTELRSLRGETLSRGELLVHFLPELSLEADLVVHEGRLSDMAGMFIEVPGLDARVDGELELAGPPERMDGGGTLELRDVDLFGERFPSGQARWAMRDGVFTLQGLRIARREGREGLVARGSVGRAWALNAEVDAGGLALEDMDLVSGRGVPLGGRLSAHATLGGTLMAPQPAGWIELARARVSSEPAGPSRIRFRSQGRVLSWTGDLLGGTAQTRGELRMEAPYDWRVDGALHAFPLHLFYPMAADGRPVRALASGTAGASGSFGEGGPPLDVTGELSSLEMSWGSLSLSSPSPWSFRLGPGGWRVAGARLVGGRTDLAVDAAWSPSQGLELSGGGLLDIALLRAVRPEFLRAEGVARLGLEVREAAAGAEPVLRASLSGATLRTSWFPHPLEGVEASLVGSPEGYELESFSAGLGGGRLDAGGRIEARRWVPVAYDLGARLRDARVRYLDYLPAIVGDADLHFDGPAGSLLLSGDVRIDDMRFTEPVDWQQEVVDLRARRLAESTAVEPEEPLFALDLAVKADGTVTVRNNLAEGVADVDLRLLGDTARTGMTGDIRMRPGGRMFLQDRAFDIQRAELHYVDPWSFDPELDFLLETELRSRDERYRVRYRVTGPFSDWRSQASSEPALSQADINALLLFGLTREELERYGGVSAALAQEGADILLHGIGIEGEALRQIRSGVFQVDRLDLVTGVSERGNVVSSDWRLLFEKRLLAPYDLLLMGEVNLSRFGDNYLAVERPLAGGLFGRAFWASQQQERNLAIGGAYGLEFTWRWESE